MDIGRFAPGEPTCSWVASGCPRQGKQATAKIGGTNPDLPVPVPDQWQVQVQAQIQTKANVLVKTAGLGPDEIRAAHFTPIDDVSQAVRASLERAGGASTLCVLPQGPQTIPYLATEA